MTTVPPAHGAAGSDPVAVDNRPAATDPLTEDERSELTWLRTENRLLRVERDILLRVASGYAEDMDTLLHRRTPRSAS